MKDQINIIREALENSSDLIFKDVTKSHLRAQALAALAQLEAMAKEPAAWGLIDKGETKARGVSTWDKSREAEWTPLYAAPVAQQPQAEAVPSDLVQAVDTLLSEALCDCKPREHHLSGCYLFDLDMARNAMLVASKK